MASKKQFPLRLDPKLYQALERWAGDEFRSVNAHIEFLLREAVRRTGRLREGDETRSADDLREEQGTSDSE
ncbi:hypothetical protein [Paradesulfitobacterium ferrireducens]|uniref:hypothetical protein n=1 Tax=Paradesulfitobacterium ferrireducens TaxID=2816476 RepID=UPI001F219ABE|nr:hypothetical protein [Paradesulfitobacterium ferrireducens]